MKVSTERRIRKIVKRSYARPRGDAASRKLCRGRRGSDGLGGGVVPTRGVVSDAILQSAG
jgi:hypothetical protein